MDSSDLSQFIEYFGTSGFALSIERMAILDTSLTLLKDDGKFSSVKFWGSIVGTTGTYYIAQGIGNNPLSEKRTFSSLDCITFAQLPSVNAAIKTKAAHIYGRFTGNLAHEHRINTADVDSDDAETMNEDIRLAAVVELIDATTRIIPRGAVIRQTTGKIVQNRSFQGLSVGDSTKLGSYLHFREAIELPKKSLLERNKLDRAIDFLDTCSEDVPGGSWIVQAERGGSVVVLRNLVWPGFTFFLVPDTCKYAHLYNGTGERNHDLGFML